MAILIDPDKCDNGENLKNLLYKSKSAGVSYLFIGGSTVTKVQFENTIDFIKLHSDIPVVIFPGSFHQISNKADAILYLSLISGRNPDFLIGHHVQSASELIEMNIEVLPTGYILIDGGIESSVAYVSQTIPIPRDMSVIAKNTAIAGVLQGKKILFFDAGSGAVQPVPSKLINEVNSLGVPIIVGGGINNVEYMQELKNAGVNIIVIGNHLEKNIDFIDEIKKFNSLT